MRFPLALFIAASALSLATACQTDSRALSAKTKTDPRKGPYSGSWKSEDQDKAPRPSPCKAGSSYKPITLGSLDKIPTPAELGFKAETTVLTLPDAMTYIIRLDTCDDGKTLDLKQVVVNQVLPKSEKEITEKFFVVNACPGSVVKGLKEALRDQDPTKVSIFLPYGDGQGLRIAGKDWKGKPVAYFYEGTKEADPKTVYLGNLEIRDPFAKN